MKKNIIQPAILNFITPLFLFLLLTGCKKTETANPSTSNSAGLMHAERGKDIKETGNFQQVNLVANNNEYNAQHIDPNLLNAWGLVFTPTGIAWVSAQAGHVSTIYDKEGNTIRPPVNIPSPMGPTGGNPTGVIFNGTSDFILSNGSPARFIFDGVDGILSGWNPATGNSAVVIKNNSSTAAYTGLTMAINNGANYLYAANFKSGNIDVFDKNFNPVMMSFKDWFLPRGFAPFNIQNLQNLLYVTYAKVSPQGDDQAGPGNGFVDIFRPNGTFIKRLASRGALNSPWGITLAPKSFIKGSHQDMDDDDNDREDRDDMASSARMVVLVGNLGDGKINIYSMKGRFMGQLGENKKPIVIEGLWALVFPPATATSIDPNRLYFTAGPSEEQDGLFGYLINTQR
jgi:uncharacterized protein (TIGR03118 family)